MDVHEVLVQVDEIYREYLERDNTDLPVNIEVLSQIARERSGLQINFTCKSWPSDLIKGRLVRYKESADIEYSDSMNTCWTRFVIVKELCHLMIDKEEDFTGDIGNLVECLVSCNIAKDGEKSPEEISEYLCTIAAVELLVPLSVRRDIYRDYKNNNITTLKVANIFKVPAHYIEILFSEPYRNHIDVAHYKVKEEVAEKNAAEARDVDRARTAAEHQRTL